MVGGKSVLLPEDVYGDPLFFLGESVVGGLRLQPPALATAS